MEVIESAVELRRDSRSLGGFFQDARIILSTHSKRFLGAGLLINIRVIRFNIESKVSGVLDMPGLT